MDAKTDDYLDSIKERLRNSKQFESLIISWEFLSIIGLEEFNGVDIDLLPTLENIPKGSDAIDIQSYLQHRIVEILHEKLEAGKSSGLIDIKKLENTPASVLIPKITQSRKEEISRTPIQVIGHELIVYDIFMNEIERRLVPDQGDVVLLENIWTTALGYQVLSTINVGLRTDLKGLKKIQRILEKYDVEPRIERVGAAKPPPILNMSNAMKSYIMSRFGS